MNYRRWTREETVVCFALYCITPFNKLSNQKQYARIAEKIGRSPASLAMKLCNFAAIDPIYQGKGLRSYALLDKAVFDEFQHNWAALSKEAEDILGLRLFEVGDEDNLHIGPQRGKHYSEVLEKNGRFFFRRAVLAAYDNTCCISGVTNKRLLVASHIKPWYICNKQTEGANPANGLCLNSFYDRAFDEGIFTIDKHLKIWVSNKVRKEYKDECTQKWLYCLEGQKITSPSRFRPRNDFLEYHNDKVFIR